jgi:uncharacterized protein YcaQ
VMKAVSGMGQVRVGCHCEPQGAKNLGIAATQILRCAQDDTDSGERIRFAPAAILCYPSHPMEATTFHLTKAQARRVLLAHQNLWPPHGLLGKAGVLAFIRHVGSIQFDPLNIVGHNPELVLQARVADFRPAMLQELLYHERYLVDGWDKMVSIYPVEDWPYFRRQREAMRREMGGDREEVAAIVPRVREAIAERGPLSSLDLDADQVVDWWWGPTRLKRVALETMYAGGELVIHHRVHTRKVYDLASRHIPAELWSSPDPFATEEQYHDWRILRRIGGVGLLWGRSGDAWLAMSGIKTGERTAALARLVEQGRAIAVGVEGIAFPFYLRSADQPALERVLDAPDPPPQAAIIAPLDNLLWDRRLVAELFGFSYRWEVYKPVAERRHGYYVLPILHGDRFVARFEPGRDRRQGALLIKGWWWEPGVTPSPQMQAELRRCFARFLAYLGAESLNMDARVAQEAGLEWLSSAESVAQ